TGIVRRAVCEVGDIVSPPRLSSATSELFRKGLSSILRAGRLRAGRGRTIVSAARGQHCSLGRRSSRALMAERRITINIESPALEGEFTTDRTALARVTEQARAELWERLFPLLTDGQPHRVQLTLISSEEYGTPILEEGRRLQLRLRCTVEPVHEPA